MCATSAPTIHVVNDTRGCVLASQCHLANTFWRRFLGLMGKTNLAPGDALLIIPGASIHTFFMRFPIDVLFLDRHDRVVGMRVAMLPNRPYAGARGARYIIELPPETLPPTGTSLGDQLVLTPSPHNV
jgi:hypothetical protein